MELKIGDHVRFLRMANKAVALSGVIEQINDDGKTVNVKVDGSENFLETAHLDDITADTPATPELLGSSVMELEPAAPTFDPAPVFVSLTMVNGKPI